TVAATVRSPALPVKALELPELTTMARALPPFSASRHQSTGADEQRERVKAPAMVVPGASSASIRSRPPFFLRPIATPPSRTPAIRGSTGWDAGASGETGSAGIGDLTSWRAPGEQPGPEPRWQGREPPWQGPGQQRRAPERRPGPRPAC